MTVSDSYKSFIQPVRKQPSFSCSSFHSNSIASEYRAFCKVCYAHALSSIFTSWLLLFPRSPQQWSSAPSSYRKRLEALQLLTSLSSNHRICDACPSVVQYQRCASQLSADWTFVKSDSRMCPPDTLGQNIPISENDVDINVKSYMYLSSSLQD